MHPTRFPVYSYCKQYLDFHKAFFEAPTNYFLEQIVDISVRVVGDQMFYINAKESAHQQLQLYHGMNSRGDLAWLLDQRSKTNVVSIAR
jgi:hypothetical protein